MSLGKRMQLVLLAVVILLFSATGCSEARYAAGATISVKEAVTGDLPVGLSVQGKTTLSITNLTFEVGGKLKAVYVNAGDTVNKGDLLAELDDANMQLALNNARVNLEKANAAYTDAVAASEFSVQTETESLAAINKKIENGFDDFVYKTAITNAELNVTRKNKELELAQEELRKAQNDTLDPLDAYSFNQAISAASRNLARKSQELADAREDYNKAEARLKAYSSFDSYNYDVAMTNAQVNMERKTRELEEAKKAYSTAASKNKPFDDFGYLNAIENARLVHNRKVTEHNNAISNVNAARDNYNNAIAIGDPDLIASTSKDYNDAVKAEEITRMAVNEAAAAYNQAQSALEHARRLYIEESGDKKTTELENLAKAAQTAQNAYDDAVIALNKAKTDLQHGRDTTSKSDYETLEREFEAAKDKLTAAENAFEDAQTAVSDADSALEHAITASSKDFTEQQKKVIESADKALFNAKNAYEDAVLTLQKAKDELERAKENYTKDLDSTQSSKSLQELKVESTKNTTAAVVNAYYNVEDAKTKLQTAENEISKVRLTAPINAKVLNVSKKVGEVVSAPYTSPEMKNTLSSDSSSFIQLVDLSEIYLTAFVKEEDVANISVGQKITATIDALGEANLSATVTSVSSAPTLDPAGLITYEVIGKFDEFNENIKDNMGVTLTFVSTERVGAILVPNQAVYIEGSQHYVDIALDETGDNVEKRPVTCGFSNGVLTEILNGLAAGEKVVFGDTADDGGKNDEAPAGN